MSAAEKLFVWRHRTKSISGRLLGCNGPRMSQAEAAAALGVSRVIYGKLESGLRTALSADDVERLAAALEPLLPTLGELCHLARRRSGKLLITIEHALGVSRPRFHELERAGDTSIVQFWENCGFRFPIRSRFSLLSDVNKV